LIRRKNQLGRLTVCVLRPCPPCQLRQLIPGSGEPFFPAAFGPHLLQDQAGYNFLLVVRQTRSCGNGAFQWLVHGPGLPHSGPVDHMLPHGHANVSTTQHYTAVEQAQLIEVWRKAHPRA